MELIPSIGLEIHIVLDVERKAFSPELVNNVSWISLGFPGTLPILNFEAIKKTIQLSFLLRCNVNYSHIVFDRKNYFYYDLPKGYQITQHFHPIGTNGFLELSSGKKIRIKQVHLEEDSAQQFKQGHFIKLLFGRLGRAVSEIVTEPDFSSYQEVEEFLQLLRRLCSFNKISSASYEEGEMRVDLNVSVRYKHQNSLSPKSEVKNLNSMYALKTSLEELLEFQKSKLIEGETLPSYTYGWSEKLKKCVVMRQKSSSSEYFYIPESNLPKVVLNKSQYKKLTENLCWDFSSLEEELLNSGLKKDEVAYLLDNYSAYSVVKKLNSVLDNWVVSYNWIINIVSGLTSSFKNLPYEEIEKLIIDVEKNQKINKRIAKSILKSILEENLTYKAASKKLKVSPICGEDVIRTFVVSALDKYQDQIPALSKNLQKLERLIIGECMKLSNGQADPIITKKLFDELYPSYLKI